MLCVWDLLFGLFFLIYLILLDAEYCKGEWDEDTVIHSRLRYL